MEENTQTPTKTDKPETIQDVTEVVEAKKQPVDIFLWANKYDALKDKLDVELYLFTKNYTVYATNYQAELKNQLKVLFLYDLLSEVQTGAAMGLKVRDFEAAEAEENVLSRTYIDNVQHAQEVMEQIMHGGDSLEIFSEGDHEFKRVKGMVAKFVSGDGKPFYSAKLLPQSQVLKGATAWMFDEGAFRPFSADAGLRVTPDNQVLIIDDEIFAFSESKFERLFGYSAKKQAIAEEKIRAIEAAYKLSLPDGMTLEGLIKEKPALVNKLQKFDTAHFIPSDKLMEQSDEMELSLMQDEAEAIIIMDGRDASTFVNLLNDDYVESPMTGNRYEIKGKKRLGTDEQGS